MYCVFLGKARETVTVPTITKDKLNLISNATAGLTVKGDGGSNDGYIALNCSQNSHAVKIKAPPHSAGQSYTLTLPQSITNNTFLKTDGSGNLSFAAAGGANTPAFSVKKSSNQTIASTTNTKMELDSEIFDTDNKYDNSTNYRFTPGVAGKYFLSLASSFQNFQSDEIMSVTISKNGSGISSFNNISGNYSDDFTAYTSVIDEANTTDYYEAFIFHRAGSSQTMVGSVSIFSGYKIIE